MSSIVEGVEMNQEHNGYHGVNGISTDSFGECLENGRHGYSCHETHQRTGTKFHD